MTTFYNRVAGQSLHRLEALSDGVFSIAMTLMVLELRAPAAAAIHGEEDLWHALVSLAPRLITYLMSFMTLGIFWVGQQTQHDNLERSDRGYTWVNILFLMAVSLVPFSTAVLAEHVTYRVALLTYWVNILMLGVLVALAWWRARSGGLVRADAPPDFGRAMVRRVVSAQVLYAIGASLCVFSTWWSIGVIVAVQVMYAIGPRMRPFVWL